MERNEQDEIFDTYLSPEEEKQYQSWRSKLPQNLQNEDDYDLRGLWKENPNVQPDERLHFTDTYKKPNHITFSTGSKYSNESHKGGTWRDLGNGQWAFEASDWNMKQYDEPTMRDYFNRAERGSIVKFPATAQRREEKKEKDDENENKKNNYISLFDIANEAK